MKKEATYHQKTVNAWTTELEHAALLLPVVNVAANILRFGSDFGSSESRRKLCEAFDKIKFEAEAHVDRARQRIEWARSERQQAEVEAEEEGPEP